MPGSHLRCRQLGPHPCPPRGLCGSSPLQLLPPAPPLPAKPLVTQLPLSCCSTTRSCTGAPGAVGTPFCCSPAGRQPPLPALPGPPGSGEQLGASTSTTITWGWGHHLPCLLQLSPSPSTSKTCPEAPGGKQISAQGLPATRPAHRQQHPRTPGRTWDPKWGIHHGAGLQASLPLCPYIAGNTSPCPAWGCSVPCGHTHLVPGSTTIQGLRMPGWPSCQPLFCGPGSL